MSKTNGKKNCRICGEALGAHYKFIYPIPTTLLVPTDQRLYSGTFVCGNCEPLARSFQAHAGVLEGYEISAEIRELIAVVSLLGWIKYNLEGAK